MHLVVWSKLVYCILGEKSSLKDIVADLWQNSKDDELLSTINGIKLTGKDFRTLILGNWLNDQVIDAYMELIMKRSESNPQLPKVSFFKNMLFLTILRLGPHLQYLFLYGVRSRRSSTSFSMDI